jgi:hypothetical protein
MKKSTHFFTDKASIKTIDLRRITYMLIAVLFFILTELGRFIYRPFIYENNINDFGIADSVGNTGGIIVQIFFGLAILNSPGKKAYHVIGFMVIGYIIYEILQPFLPRGVFDWKDIYGTLIGGVLAMGIYWIQNVIVKSNKIFYKFK